MTPEKTWSRNYHTSIISRLAALTKVLLTFYLFCFSGVFFFFSENSNLFLKLSVFIFFIIPECKQTLMILKSISGWTGQPDVAASNQKNSVAPQKTDVNLKVSIPQKHFFMDIFLYCHCILTIVKSLYHYNVGILYNIYDKCCQKHLTCLHMMSFCIVYIRGECDQSYSGEIQCV